MDDDVNRLRIALGRISRTVDREVSGDGMTRTTLSLLGTLARHKSVGMGELAEIEGLNPTMASRLVAKLQDAGLLRRVPGDDDRRAVTVEITPEGTRTQNRLRRQRTAALAGWLEGLSPDEREALLKAVPALESLAAAMRAGRATR
ncbi:MarR family winged helix-turn-helix transcriptional regulator [uncultured Jatrophihabitans sp.]|uniref:MarR family winged helix-turn-helix transcriptional regulator n=1 Tax=uncultured Jatrophihabitans sp. TaxID=1610747 RepID=UPI0035CBA9E2